MRNFFSENEKQLLPLKISVLSKENNMFKLKESDFEFDSEWDLGDLRKIKRNKIINEKNLKSLIF